MASPTCCIWVIFTLFHLLQLLSAEEHGGQNCPSTFHCNQLGTLSYPFTTFFRPNCGLYAINCTSPTATMGLTNFSLWFDVSVSVSNKSFILGDPFLVHAISTLCSVFDDQQFFFNDQLPFTHRLPNSPSVSSRVLWNQTFWKCPKLLNMSDKSIRLVQNCSDHGNYIYRDVDMFNLQFQNPNCSKFYYPLYLLVQLSDQCSDCISGGGLCQDSKNGDRFHCIKGRRRLILLLCLGGIIALFILGFILGHLRKMKSKPTKFGSRNISAETDLGRSKMYFSLPIFSYDELEESTKDFDAAMELGDGGFGTVYYGKLKDGREVAVKRLYERNCRQLEQFMNEIQILTSLRHRNLVTLYGCTSRRSRELLLVYEYVPNGTIADHLNGDRAKCGTLTWSIRMSIAIETARALSYLHASDIIHRDVKSNNILLDNNFSVKVADFGLSRLFPNDVTHVSTVPQGTPGYLDPEYHSCYQLTGKSDVYSFGVVLLELISSLPAIDITRTDGEINLSCYAMNRIRSCKFHELIDPGLRFESNFKVRRMTTAVAELAFRCLQDKKDFRPSMEEVLEALQNIESADYSEVAVEEQKDEKDGKSITQTESDYIWLLRQTDNPLSPNSVIHNWSPKGISLS